MQTRLRWRLWWGLAESSFSGRLESSGRFCVGEFGGNLALVAARMSSHLIYFVKKLYKFCGFNASLKNNSAINCITVQHKTGSFPSTLTGHTKLVDV
jgi:hypothetical protein